MLIFVAYSAKDWKLVESLIVDLGVLGYDIHFERKVLGGSLSWAEIFQSIQRCDVFVFTVTPNTLVSYSRLLEFEYALILRKTILAVQLQQTDLALLPAGIPGVIEYQAGSAILAKTLNLLTPSPAISTTIEPPSLKYLISRLRRRTVAPHKSALEKAELLLNFQELLERRETYAAAETMLDVLAPDVTRNDAIAGEFKATYRRIRRMKASIRNRRLALVIIGIVLLIGIVGGVRLIQSNLLLGNGADSTSLQQITTLLPTKDVPNSQLPATGEVLPTQPPSGAAPSDEAGYQPTLPALPSLLRSATPTSTSPTLIVTASPPPSSAASATVPVSSQQPPSAD
jgi:hypothetical protein